MIICSKDICLSFFNHSLFVGFHSYFMIQLYIICMHTSRDIIISTDNAAVEQCPKGICLELLVLPAAERRGNQEFAAQLPRSPRSEAEGGTRK